MLILGIGGGVATFALHLAKAAGARVVVTSSSDEKLATAGDLGADIGVNYTTEGWVDQVRTATDGGVDATVPPDARPDVSDASAASDVPSDASAASDVPSDASAGLLDAVNAQRWVPVIDSVRPLSEAADAHAREEAGRHFGKLVLVP